MLSGRESGAGARARTPEKSSSFLLEDQHVVFVWLRMLPLVSFQIVNILIRSDSAGPRSG